MANSDNCELPLNALKHTSGGFSDNCDNKMGQAKAMKKIHNKMPFSQEPDQWSGIKMQDDNTTFAERL